MKRLSLSLISFLMLTSCQTLDGIGSDLSTAWNKSGEALRSITASDVTGETDTPAPQTTLPVGATDCPPVKVMEELRTMVEFQDLANPTPKTEVGRLRIESVEARCEITEKDLAVHLDITVHGTLGPKARWKEDDKPSFAFPYFVAVTGPQGGVLAKEIFAASLSYEARQDEITQTESITQHIPLDENGIPSYTVLIGFQLSDEQLTFNRSQPILGGAP